MGPWKSDGLNLLVTPDSTAVWANCSQGTIPGGLTVDESGSFRAVFDFTFLPGAAGLQPVTTRFLMEGRLAGDQLSVALDAMTASLPVTHVLTRGEGVPYAPCP